MEFDFEKKSNDIDINAPNIPKIRYWQKITNFVLKENTDSFNLTLKAIRRNYDHIKLKKLQNILQKKKKRRMKSNRRVSFLRIKKTRKNSLLNLTIAKSRRSIANSQSLHSQSFNISSPKRKIPISNSSFLENFDDTFTEICEGDNSVSSKSKNSSASKKKRQSPDTATKKEFLEQARKKYDKSMRKNSRRRILKFNHNQKPNKDDANFFKMQTIRCPGIGGHGLTNGLYRSLSPSKRFVKENRQSIMTNLPKLENSDSDISFNINKAKKRPRCRNSLESRNKLVLTSCGVIKKRDLFTNESHQNYFNNKLIMEKYKPMLDLCIPEQKHPRLRNTKQSKRVVCKTNLHPFKRRIRK
ncbi:unnamed protein product [Moneuplotes crassus]|uniref:Uncharacterized protein n=1 Tax=Euplotes crassus TaxID=5936 RepID=A0AAD1UGA0_EUPCR|nr:unnamed protein product [Moneuplotes crassus]